MNHQNENVIVTGDRIAGIAQATEASSIGLLAAIDGTVDAMQGIAKIMSGFSTMLSNAVEEIAAKTIRENEYIDPDGIAVDAMASAATNLQNFLTKLVLKRTAIDKDNRLKEHHCEALHDAYEEATSEVAALVEVLLQTRAAVISHDLAAEPRGDSTGFSTVEALISGLRNTS